MKAERRQQAIELQSSTPYDDVFRTMMVDCPQLLLPILNEIFGKNYTGNEKIVFNQNEHFINQQDGAEEKRITDSSFTVIGETEDKYIFECQAVADNTLLIRIFEYITQDALDHSVVSGSKLIVTIPQAAILFLRSGKRTPDEMEVEETNQISAYSWSMIRDMSKKVVENIAKKYENVREGVTEVMGGRVLEYEGKRIFNEGRNEGFNEGRSEGQKSIALNLYRAGIPVENIAQYAEVSVEQVEKWISSDEVKQDPLAA
ncbi:MAG: hypothetical protein IJI41_04685 [Anaerolineaceae bacterium]|nr:hypothetical protein [Anaerolineaceae bacterium]